LLRHFIDEVVPRLEDAVVDRLMGLSNEKISLSRSRFHETSSFDSIWLASFHASVSSLISKCGGPSIPADLEVLLTEGFHYLEQENFERDRADGHHLELTYKVPATLSPHVLQYLFVNKCTASLGSVVQPVWQCTSTQRLLCRASNISLFDHFVVT
jgi:hypothetical protein